MTKMKWRIRKASSVLSQVHLFPRFSSKFSSNGYAGIVCAGVFDHTYRYFAISLVVSDCFPQAQRGNARTVCRALWSSSFYKGLADCTNFLGRQLELHLCSERQRSRVNRRGGLAAFWETATRVFAGMRPYGASNAVRRQFACAVLAWNTSILGVGFVTKTVRAEEQSKEWRSYLNRHQRNPARSRMAAAVGP